jgi:hypothetical protein
MSWHNVVFSCYLINECYKMVKVKFIRAGADVAYSSTLYLAWLSIGVGGQCQAPVALPLGRTRYPLYRRLCGFQGRSGRVREISLPPGFDPRTAQRVVSLILSGHFHQLVGDASSGALNTSSALRLVSSAWFRISLNILPETASFRQCL